MATINLGSIKFKWKGTYNGGTAYTVDDVVEYNGSSYICILASTGNLPTDTTYFEQMSSAGTNGTDGTDLTSTLTTQGDIVYRDASGLARLGAGSAGQLLQSGGTGANVSWTDAPAGGLVQTISTTTITPSSYSLNNSFTDITGLTATITPTSSSNKVLITCSINYGSTTNYPPVFRLYRTISGGSPTLIGAGTPAGSRQAANTAPQNQGLNGDKNRGMHTSINFLDTPNTTTSTTYKINGGILQSAGVLQINTSGSSYDYDDNYIARTSSTITVQEVV